MPRVYPGPAPAAPGNGPTAPGRDRARRPADAAAFPILGGVLRTLELRDFAIVDELALDLAPGLNVLTGETGAGKSIVVDALELLSGGRADVGVVRAGAEAALVQATFEGAPFGSASRRVAVNGRHGARLDGELVTVAELSTAVGAAVRVFGQHAAQQLLSPAAQREQLDRLLAPGDRGALARHREAFAALQQTASALDELRAARRERSRRLDTLAHQLSEIDRVAPVPGEDESLAAELAALQHAERIVLAGSRALAALAGDDGGAAALAAEALRELEGAARYAAAYAPLARDLRELVGGLGAVATEVEAFLSDFDADPRRLDDVQARLAALEGLERKYGPDVAAVLEYRAAAAAEVAGLQGADDEVARLEAEERALEVELDELGRRLTAARGAAGGALAVEVLPLLVALGLPAARFEVEVAPAQKRGRSGADDVAFLFGANPGEPLKRVSDAASGGELSRIMLALHLVTGSDIPTVAFDEVDAGVGGRTADQVGALLARLAGERQVLVVTHLAQVAAYASAHFKVDKAEVGGRTVTRVRRLAEPERVEELARLLSGTLTEASMRHAAELLARAGAMATAPAGAENRARASTGARAGRRQGSADG